MTIRIRTPCEEGWDQMRPRGQGRHCDRCDRTVIDFTRLTRREAKVTIAAANGSLCGHARVVLATGELVFRVPEPSRASHWAGGLVLAAALTSGCSSPAPRPVRELATAPLDPSSPMAPVDSVAMPPEPSLVTRAVPQGELLRPEDAGAPTAEQRALTAHKHHPHPPIGPTRRPTHELMTGGMF